MVELDLVFHCCSMSLSSFVCYKDDPYYYDDGYSSYYILDVAVGDNDDYDGWDGDDSIYYLMLLM